MPRTPNLALLGPIALLALAGCTHESNDRHRLGESGTLPAFTVSPHTLPPINPGITGLDRDNWEPITLLIPVNGTAHQPTYTTSAFDTATLARQRGEFPTAESALELIDPDEDDEILFAIEAHASAALDAVLLVPRLLLRPPTESDWSPTLGYGRAPLADITAPGCGADADECCPAPACEDAPAEEEVAPADEVADPEAVEEMATDAVEHGSATE